MTTLMNFEPDLPVLSMRRHEGPVPEMKIIKSPISQRTAFVGKPDSEWNWSDLRDYVVRSLQERGLPMERNPVKEAGIFKSFMARHGHMAVAIARYVVEVEDARWSGQPITINRFCKAADVWFSDKIKDRLTA